MTIRTRAELKAMFENGDQPDENAFIDLIDSFAHMEEPLPAVSAAALTDINTSEWLAVDAVPTYVDTSTFTVPGEHTGIFLARRRVRLTLTPPGVAHGAVLWASYDALSDATTVVLTESVVPASVVAVDVGVVTPLQAGGSVSMPMLGSLSRAAITGLTLSNFSTAQTPLLTIESGFARDMADGADIYLWSTITKDISLPWVGGTMQGGLLVGAIAASAVYAVWLIMRSDTGVADVGIDPSFTAPTLPANYDKARLIGFIRTDIAANVSKFVQNGDYFVLMGSTPAWDFQATVPGDNATRSGVLALPPNGLATIRGMVYSSAPVAQCEARLFHPDAAPAVAFGIALSTGALQYIMGDVVLALGSSSGFKYTLTSTGASSLVVYLKATGCWMFSRSNP